jgi:putative transposase
LYSRRRFLRAQASTMLACDLFTVDRAVTLRWFYVFFVTEVASRYVHIVATTSNPDGAWTTQQIRNLLMDLGERADQFSYLTGIGRVSSPRRLTRCSPTLA